MSIQLSQADRRNIRKVALQNLRNLVFGAQSGVTLDGTPVPQFLAGPAPSNVFSRWQWNAGRETCNRWASGKQPQILPGREAYYRNLCTPYIESEFGPVPDGTLAPPFTGGQCPGTTYAFELGQIISGQCGAILTFSPGSVGPISSLNFVITDVGGFPNNLRGQLTVVAANGTFVSPQVQGNNVNRPCFNGPIATSGPNNCGDPPLLYDPGDPVGGVPGPTPVPQPPGVPWPFPDITIDVDGDGNIIIDFGDGDTETIDPTSDPDGGPNDGPPGDIGEPGPTEETEAGGEAEGEADEGQVLVGLRLDLIAAPPSAIEFLPGLYRGAAYVYMGAPDGLDQDFAGSILRSGQFIFAEKDNLTRWQVVSNPGYNWAVTPFYREVDA